MKRLALGLFGVAVLAGACGTEKPSESSPYIAGFNPAPVADGFTRFVLPAVRDIQPGQDEMWCQYVSEPATEDTDIVFVTGEQSKGGHHLVLYGTKKPGTVGESHVCKDTDQLSLTFLGGIGGEGVGGVIASLPQGVTFRLPKGWQLLSNTHFVNTGSKPIDGQGVIDVKMAKPDASRKPLGLFVNVGLDIDIPKGTVKAQDVSCTIQQDLDVILFFNHQHERGTSIFTDLKRAGEETNFMVRRDDVWRREMVFAPEMTKFALQGEGSLKLKKGDVLRTHCEWENTEDRPLKFPEEMCVGTFVYVGDNTSGAPQIACTDGEWGDGN